MNEAKSAELALRRQRQAGWLSESLARPPLWRKWNEVTKQSLIAQAEIIQTEYIIRYDYARRLLCNFQGTRTQRKLNEVEVGEQISRWPSVRKPPVPIPNTVVKTYCSDNTWRETAWEDSRCRDLNWIKREFIKYMSSLFFKK